MSVEIRDLGVAFPTDTGSVQAVNGVSLEVKPGEIVALVGESGSGKTVTGRSVLGLIDSAATVNGAVLVEGADVRTMSPSQLRAMRGRDAAMVFQEPSAALNPVYPIWWQMAEGLRAHDPKITRSQARQRSVEALRAVGIEDPERRINQYPHEFSGGQKQRIMIAMAIELGASTIVADEPTTALDVTVQAEILALLRSLRDAYGTAIILITHNMGVVADLADSVVVMRRGEVVERAAVSELFAHPKQEYTRQLLRAVPRLGSASLSKATPAPEREALVQQPAVVQATDIAVTYPGRLGSPAFTAVDGVSLTIHAGEVVGLVGESGSGKTTLGRAIVGLEKLTGGSLEVFGRQLNGSRPSELREIRRKTGFVFQDPATSFNPFFTVEQCVAEPLVIASGYSKQQRRKRARALLDAVELPAAVATRYPHELSGGQRQRVSLARSLVLEPELLIADEPTSALDVSVQAVVLDLFTRLQRELGFAALFISHDLAVVDMVAHRVGVLRHGQLIEEGWGFEVMGNPHNEYTRQLVAALPVPDPEEQARRRQAAKPPFASGEHSV